MHTLLHSVPLTLHQATVDPHLHRRLLDTHREVWVSLLWSHCSFLLGPGVHKLLFVPSTSLFPQPCVSSGCSMAALCSNGNFLQKGLCHTQIYFPQSSCPCSRPLMTHNSAGDTQTLNGRSGSVSVGSPGVHKVWFEPSDHL